MFDRTFFEHHFHDQVRAFARERQVSAPVVELLLDDGNVLYLRSVLQTREHWLCLAAYDDEATRQIYCPYFSIRRITLFTRPPKGAPSGDPRFHLG